ncbi:hypothetical protein SOCEGT47_056650 [Sorangium cellulosum]|uniref:Uncharacterized protein n=1 Tax=Sorangium cellulosum TaxID=56 RepID=A0A4P2Q777_SORCE|nr:hypothetical protein [Sorangium cellulosum]AUX25121.1 hypothetical protein SOCEGT47_056650 [Sorangium cellulosum]
MKGCSNTTAPPAGSGAYVVGARVDALRIGYPMRVCPAALRELTRAKLDARSGAAYVTIAGERFAVERRGLRGKPFSAVGPSGRIFVGEGDVIVDLAVPFLASRPLAEAVNHADMIAAHFAASGSEAPVGQVRELDLCADIAGATFSEADREAFVGRLRRMSSWRTDARRTRNGLMLSGLQIGDRRNLAFVLYDKTGELRLRRDPARAAMERTRWIAHGWDGQGQIWRAEFRPRGRHLAELGLRTPSTLPERLDPIWQRFTRKALRLVVLETATRKERCKVDPRWAALQQAVFTQSGACPAVRLRRAPSGATSETAEPRGLDRANVNQANPRMMMAEHLIHGMVAAYAAGDVKTACSAHDALGWLIGPGAAPRGAVIDIGVARNSVPAPPSPGARGPGLATPAASQGPACSSRSASRPMSRSMTELRSGTRTERAAAPDPQGYDGA